MKGEIVTVAGRTGKKLKPGEVESINIRRASNGFSVDVQRKRPPQKPNQPYDWEAGHETQVYESLESMLEGVRKAFGEKKQ
ncbi:MAG TPA: hypothetical protein PLK67_17570 [Bryobacteraceae bacterium]|nr:hypothetical protein [Bryobacteraceae bacterium]